MDPAQVLADGAYRAAVMSAWQMLGLGFVIGLAAGLLLGALLESFRRPAGRDD